MVKDILTFDRLSDADIALMDIHDGRLGEMARQCWSTHPGRRRIQCADYNLYRSAAAMADADAVIVTILGGGTDILADILIPKKYGVDITVGDTRGPSGIFRAPCEPFP